MSLVDMSEYRYLHLLRVLGAWWSLGSSALEPHVLLQHMADPLVELNDGESADSAGRRVVAATR
jgi:hypothetical protein